MFGKLKLNLEDIQVESFATTDEARAADGSVIGASGLFSTAPDCYNSCLHGSCDSCGCLTDDGSATCVSTCIGCGGGFGSTVPEDPTCLTTNDQGLCLECC